MHITMTRRVSRKLLVSAAAATLLLGIAACGDDDDAESADSTAPAATDAPATTQPADDAAATDDVAAFCEAEVAAEASTSSEDPAVIGPAFEALSAAAPEDIKATVDTVIAEFEASGGESPEFEAAYGEMIGYVKDNCGFTELALTATEYEFGGLPSELAAGPTVVSLENIGEEVHEILLMRVNDGVTETVDELLALPEEEAETKTTFAAAAFAFPGTTGNAVVDLVPGRYIALCFLPEGATPDVIAQMEGPEDTLPEGVEVGPPHFTLGMVHELTVA
jgi:hypothetical protein